MPCLTCQDFERHKYGITIATLGLSVAAGCPYCDVIQQCLFGMFHPEDISNFSLLRFLGREEFNQQVEVNLRHNYRPKDPRFGLVREGNTEDIAIINPAGNFKISFWSSHFAMNQSDWKIKVAKPQVTGRNYVGPFQRTLSLQSLSPLCQNASSSASPNMMKVTVVNHLRNAYTLRALST